MKYKLCDSMPGASICSSIYHTGTISLQDNGISIYSLYIGMHTDQTHHVSVVVDLGEMVECKVVVIDKTACIAIE